MTTWVLAGTSLLLSGCFAVEEMGHDEKPLVLKTGDKVTVIKVVKGDEVTFLKDGKEGKIRLLGVLSFDAEIDTPGLNAIRQASVDYVTKTALKKEAVITLSPKKPKDQHGRYLGYLTVDDLDVGETLVTNGLSMVYTEYPFEREELYLKAEAFARDAKKNLWERDEPRALVKGLREQWRRFRSERGMPLIPDPILADAQAPKLPKEPTPISKK